MNQTPPPEEEGSVPVCDTIEEQLNAFTERFDALMEEAKQYGFTTVVGICAHDVLDAQGWRSLARKGNYYAALGLLDILRDEFLKQ
jgi:hypothetical protein